MRMRAKHPILTAGHDNDTQVLMLDTCYNTSRIFIFGEFSGLFYAVRGGVQGVVNAKFDLRQICLTLQWPATQSTSKNSTLYITLHTTYYDDYRGLHPYLQAQVGSQRFVFKEW